MLDLHYKEFNDSMSEKELISGLHWDVVQMGRVALSIRRWLIALVCISGLATLVLMVK